MAIVGSKRENVLSTLPHIEKECQIFLFAAEW